MTAFVKSTLKLIRLAAPAVLALALAGCSDPAPLAVSYRRSLLDSAGLVLIVKNTGSRYLSCRLFVNSRVTSRSTHFDFSLAPHDSREVGAFQAGWSFKSGERVRIQVEGHSTYKFAVP